MLLPSMNLIALIVATLISGSAIAEDAHETHTHNFANDIDALHAVLAPLWHMNAGKERSRKVCEQADKLDALAKDVRSGDIKKLLTSVADLKAQCQSSPADIDAVFSSVHDAFHHLVEAKAH